MSRTFLTDVLRVTSTTATDVWIQRKEKQIHGCQLWIFRWTKVWFIVNPIYQNFIFLYFQSILLTQKIDMAILSIKYEFSLDSKLYVLFVFTSFIQTPLEFFLLCTYKFIHIFARVILDRTCEQTFWTENLHVL